MIGHLFSEHLQDDPPDMARIFLLVKPCCSPIGFWADCSFVTHSLHKHKLLERCIDSCCVPRIREKLI
jgi:hypothetical protein